MGRACIERGVQAVAPCSSCETDQEHVYYTSMSEHMGSLNLAASPTLQNRQSLTSRR